MHKQEESRRRVAYDVAAGDAEGDKRGGEPEASSVCLGPGEDRVVVHNGGAVAEDGGRTLQEAQRRERARVCRIRAEIAHAMGCPEAAWLGLALCERLSGDIFTCLEPGGLFPRLAMVNMFPFPCLQLQEYRPLVSFTVNFRLQRHKDNIRG
jgi:hypothetical protein